MNVLSLFSGCGGMDLGLEGGFLAPKVSVNQNIYKNYIENYNEDYVYLKETGFKTVFAIDILKPAKNAWCNFFNLKNNNSDKIFHLGSIVDYIDAINNGELSFPDNIDIVTGGFPCQDFSFAGKRKGFASDKDHNGIIYNEPTEATRGKLYLWLKKTVEITKPKIFIAENVKGLVTLGDVKQIIEEDFREIDQGYVVLNAQVLNAKDYGVAQNRERVIFIGISKRYANQEILDDLLKQQEKSSYYPYPPKTHGDELYPYTRLIDVIGKLAEPDLSEDKSQQSYSKAKYFPGTQGNIEVNMLGQAPTIRAEHHGNIEFRRLSEENGGKNTDEYWLPQRRLTVRECALIQSFPPNYEFVFNHNRENSVSASGAYKIIGNAVPPLLSFAIGVHLKTLWHDLFNTRDEK